MNEKLECKAPICHDMPAFLKDENATPSQMLKKLDKEFKKKEINLFTLHPHYMELYLLISPYDFTDEEGKEWSMSIRYLGGRKEMNFSHEKPKDKKIITQTAHFVDNKLSEMWWNGEYKCNFIPTP